MLARYRTGGPRPTRIPHRRPAAVTPEGAGSNRRGGGRRVALLSEPPRGATTPRVSAATGSLFATILVLLAANAPPTVHGDVAPPHEPELVYVTGGRPPSPSVTLQQFCARNPYHSVCMAGGWMSSIVSCPYTGAVVSRPEECAEFAGSGGGGGGSEEGSSASNYGEQLDSNVEDLTDKLEACVVNPATSVVHQYWSNVEFRYADFETELAQHPYMQGALGAAGCRRVGRHIIYFDRDNLESNLHVKTFETYGCNPWTNEEYAGILRDSGFDATREGGNRYIIQETIPAFRDAYGVDSYTSGTSFDNHNGSNKDSLGCTRSN